MAVVRDSRLNEGTTARNHEVPDHPDGLLSGGVAGRANARVLFQPLLAGGVTDTSTLQAAFDCFCAMEPRPVGP